MQIFVVPFEMFTAQYGFLPWLFLFGTMQLQSNNASKKIFFLFCLTTFLATPVAYAATLWHIQFFSFFSYIVLFTFLTYKQDPSIKKRALILFVVTLLINAFWILPNLYFVINHGQEVSNANINKLFSPQAFLYNKEFGNIRDIALLKTFLFDWNIYTGNNHFGYLLQPWITYLKQPFVLQIGFLLATVSGIGLLYGIWKKQKIMLAFIPCLLLCFFFLLNDNPPTGFLYRILENAIPLFKEALRFPEDKVLGIFIFLMACFFGLAQLAISNALSRIPILGRKIISIGQVSIIALLLFFSMIPAFQGNLISPFMRVEIPKDYFALFSWLNTQTDDGRIANLPIQSFWGWEYYKWSGAEQSSASSPASEADRRGKPSFQGAGFLWFGVKQPVLNRDFDRWTPYNEQYYREMSYAIYAQNPTILTSVLKKYNIHYLLLDKNIIAPQSEEKILFYKETETLLNTLTANSTITKQATFGNILLYHVNNALTHKQLWKPETYVSLFPKPQSIYEDFAYQTYGNYIATTNKGIYYPFLSLVQNTGELQKNMQLTTDGLVLKEPAANPPSLRIPSYLTNEEEIPAEVIAERLETGEVRVTLYTYSFFQDIFYPPLITTLPLPKTFSKNLPLNATLSINQKDNFPLGLLAMQQPVSLGKVMLRTDKANTITIYDKNQTTIIIPDFTRIQYSLAPCDATQITDAFGISIGQSKNGFTVLGTDTKLCMIIPLSAIPQLSPVQKEATLLNMQFSYKGDRSPNVCIARLETGGCLKSLTTGSFGILSQDDTSNLGIKITFDPSTLTNSSGPITLFGAILNKIKQKKDITYSDMYFILAKPIASKMLGTDILADALKPIKIQGENNITIPLLTDETYTKDFAALSETEVGCGGTMSQNEIQNKKTTKPNYVEYYSSEGSLCDSFSYPNLPQSNAYTIAITTQHVAGLPLSICIANPFSKRCDIYTSLSASQDKTTSLFLLPPMSKDSIGFTIDVNNFAVKKTPSRNKLYAISVIPFPYNWVTNITNNQNSIPVQSNNLIAYASSFENGWKAYQIVNGKSSMVNDLYTLLPFLFGKELTNHVLVNNWENGWILEDGQSSMVNRQFVILFLPQYLEYLGFLVLFGTFGWILVGDFKTWRKTKLVI